MSAFGDFTAALLPPEGGGPDPERTAAVARRMIDRMPALSRAALAAALVGLEATSLGHTGRTLGRLPPRQREALLARLARGPGAAAIDPLKSIAMLAHGADGFAAEIAAVGNRHEPLRRPPPGAARPRGAHGDAGRDDRRRAVGPGAGLAPPPGPLLAER